MCTAGSAWVGASCSTSGPYLLELNTPSKYSPQISYAMMNHPKISYVFQQYSMFLPPKSYVFHPKNLMYSLIDIGLFSKAYVEYLGGYIINLHMIFGALHMIFGGLSRLFNHTFTHTSLHRRLRRCALAPLIVSNANLPV